MVKYSLRFYEGGGDEQDYTPTDEDVASHPTDPMDPNAPGNEWMEQGGSSGAP